MQHNGQHQWQQQQQRQEQQAYGQQFIQQQFGGQFYGYNTNGSESDESLLNIHQLGREDEDGQQQRRQLAGSGTLNNDGADNNGGRMSMMTIRRPFSVYGESASPMVRTRSTSSMPTRRSQRRSSGTSMTSSNNDYGGVPRLPRRASSHEMIGARSPFGNINAAAERAEMLRQRNCEGQRRYRERIGATKQENADLHKRINHLEAVNQELRTNVELLRSKIEDMETERRTILQQLIPASHQQKHDVSTISHQPSVKLSTCNQQIQIAASVITGIEHQHQHQPCYQQQQQPISAGSNNMELEEHRQQHQQQHDGCNYQNYQNYQYQQQQIGHTIPHYPPTAGANNHNYYHYSTTTIPTVPTSKLPAPSSTTNDDDVVTLMDLDAVVAPSNQVPAQQYHQRQYHQHHQQSGYDRYCYNSRTRDFPPDYGPLFQNTAKCSGAASSSAAANSVNCRLPILPEPVLSIIGEVSSTSNNGGLGSIDSTTLEQIMEAAAGTSAAVSHGQ